MFDQQDRRQSKSQSATADTQGASLELRGGPLPPQILAEMEALFGAPLDGVEIHLGSERAQAAGALAITAGSEIHVAAASLDAGSMEGRRLLAHELAHVIHQRGASGADPDSPVLEDPALEAEADAAAESAVRGEPVAISGRAQQLAPQPKKPGGAVNRKDDCFLISVLQVLARSYSHLFDLGENQLEDELQIVLQDRIHHAVQTIKNGRTVSQEEVATIRAMIAEESGEFETGHQDAAELLRWLLDYVNGAFRVRENREVTDSEEPTKVLRDQAEYTDGKRETDLDDVTLEIPQGKNFAQFLREWRREDLEMSGRQVRDHSTIDGSDTLIDVTKERVTREMPFAPPTLTFVIRSVDPQLPDTFVLGDSTYRQMSVVYFSGTRSSTGEAEKGHYTTDVRDTEQEDRWFHADDANVRLRTQQTMGAPYLATYELSNATEDSQSDGESETARSETARSETTNSDDTSEAESVDTDAKPRSNEDDYRVDPPKMTGSLLRFDPNRTRGEGVSTREWTHRAAEAVTSCLDAMHLNCCHIDIETGRAGSSDETLWSAIEEATFTFDGLPQCVLTMLGGGPYTREKLENAIERASDNFALATDEQRVEAHVCCTVLEQMHLQALKSLRQELGVMGNKRQQNTLSKDVEQSSLTKKLGVLGGATVLLGSFSSALHMVMQGVSTTTIQVSDLLGPIVDHARGAVNQIAADVTGLNITEVAGFDKERMSSLLGNVSAERFTEMLWNAMSLDELRGLVEGIDVSALSGGGAQWFEWMSFGLTTLAGLATAFWLMRYAFKSDQAPVGGARGITTEILEMSRELERSRVTLQCSYRSARGKRLEKRGS